MSLRKTNKQFIKELKHLFGNKYDYSKVKYITNREKVCIICPEHGEFCKSPKKLLIGQGCPMCSKERRSKERALTNDEFIKRANVIHGSKYDYSKTNYINIDTKVCIICPEHGEFWQTPANHLRGQSCPKCSGKYHYGKEGFIKKAKSVHGDKYDYSKVEYIDSRTKVHILCPIHGGFWQKPNDHLNHKGCPLCGMDSMINNKTFPFEEFVKRAKEVHNGKYTYNKEDYKGVQNSILINCPIHGVFYQKAYVHLEGFGCSKCSHKHQYLTEEFIEKAHEIHNGKYDYSKTEYINSHTKICIICPIHGEFWQMPYLHLKGEGCSKCSHISSNSEQKVNDFINGLGFETIQNTTELLNGKEIDIYVPEKRIAIEYDGLIWHSEKFGKDKKYHLDKTIECEKQDIHLIHIFEDEWMERRDAVETYLKRALNCNKLFNNINIEECEFIEIGKTKAKNFLNKNSIENYRFSSVNVGCIYAVRIVGLISFIRKPKEENSWLITNYSIDRRYQCRNMFEKIIQYFIETYKPNTIEWSVNRRWITKNESWFFEKIGFLLKEEIKPRYYYVDNHKRLTRYEILKMKSKTKEYKRLTERGFVNKMGFHRIYDCGTLNYVYKTV